MTRHAVIHGHFYQPPREEPWLELVPQEPSAAPAHDWNERITAECYAPLAEAPVLDGAGRIIGVRNAYAHCSFDVGPTLFRWLDRHAPAVVDAIVAGDRDSARRLGHGNAIAAPYHHVILPLASRRDKITEVRWGIRDFERRFGRAPVGIWLPEAAVDEETLEVVAAEGIRFTILAPHQVSDPSADGRPVWWRGASGKSVAIFTYDGALSADIAFTDLMQDTDTWAERLAGSGTADDGDRLVTLATDGETFGHHRKGGVAAVGAIIDRLHARADVQLTNLAAMLEAMPPIRDVALHSPTSWSCSHGIERWRIDCGCRMDPHTSQAWRTPLRAGLDMAKAAIHAVVEREWPADAGDLWAAREVAGPELAGVAAFSVVARRLLEAEHHALAMFTSCGWFFDDIGRIEPRLILRHAARALEFLPSTDADAIRTALLDALGRAESNDPAKGSGRDIWHRDVLRESDGSARLAAGIAAIRELAPSLLDEVVLPAHDWRLDGDTVVTIHRRTGHERMWMTSPVVLGVVADRVHVRDIDGGSERIIVMSRFPAPIRNILADGATPIVLEATLAPEVLARVADGRMDPAAVRWAALAGAWEQVDRDGIEAADVLVHAAIDLQMLAGEPIPLDARTDALHRLAGLPTGHARDSIADRFGVVLR
ncbi:MAG: DUF3536 domain-containing protein [Gemmatimonadales bacterium]|nr:DUF3536 domain-containing protein [Gemmatimonadales bacterium]